MAGDRLLVLGVCRCNGAARVGLYGVEATRVGAMPGSRLSVFWRLRSCPVYTPLAAAGVYLYVWLWVDPKLLYFWPSPLFPAFLRTAAFSQAFAGRPGGVVAYAAAALSQFYYYPWAGALIVAVAAGLLCWAAWGLLIAAGGRRPRAVHLVPAAIVAMMYARYGHPLAGMLALLLAACLAVLYVFAPLAGSMRRAMLFLALGVPLYCAAAGAYVVYGIVCAIVEFAAYRRRVLAVLLAACALALPYVGGTVLLRLRPVEAYRYLLAFREDAVPLRAALMLCLYLLIPALAAVAALGRLLGRQEHGDDSAAAPDGPGLTRALAPASILVLSAVGLYLSSDWRASTVLQLEYAAHHGQWARVLERARALPGRSYGLLANMSVNWALYHEGQLPYALFAYRQHSRGLLRHPEDFFPPRSVEGPLPSPLEVMRACDIFYELGCINEAEHLADEALEDQGCRPWVLERLAMAKIVKRDPQAARTYLRVLSKDVLYSRRATELLRRLDEDPFLSGDAEVQRLRSLMVAHDSASPETVEAILLGLLAQNRQNRMAFEYLMAHYLLTGDLEGVARNIRRLDDFAYPAIPALYEEAIVLQEDVKGVPVDLGRRSISGETRRRFREFGRVVEGAAGDRDVALRALAKGYRTSYFPYYYFFLGVQDR